MVYFQMFEVLEMIAGCIFVTASTARKRTTPEILGTVQNVEGH